MASWGRENGVSHIAVIGNASPRRCGLATYTSHSVAALRAEYPEIIIDHYAMDDGTDVAYGPDLAGLIEADDAGAYVEAAQRIDASGAQAIWIQHEFGIYGGRAGDYLLALLHRSKLPVIATLHTVLDAPSDDERRVLGAIIARAAHLIVMAEQGRRILIGRYGADADRISVIRHGTPDRALADVAGMKAQLGLPDRPLLTTFGLLAPDKGLEFAIAALPAIVAAQPDVRYMIIGATHPALVRQHGEAYRNQLKAQVAELGLDEHVTFIDRFLEEDELLDHLQASDLYLTPYLNAQQVTSGALSFAIAMGRPIISTPYVHAREALGDGVGRLVPFRDSAAIAAECVALLGDDEARRALSERAYEAGRETCWDINARRVMAIVGDAVAASPVRLRAGPPRIVPSRRTVDLAAVARMSDGTGMLQHSIHSVPDRNHGYCVDDNARALMLVCDEPGAGDLATIYASFVQYAWNGDARRFRNFMGYDRAWLEEAGSEDSNGRVLWTLGTVARDAADPALRRWALDLYNQTAPIHAELGSPRARAFAMLGAVAALAVQPDHRVALETLWTGGAKLADLIGTASRSGWTWFESVLAYDNARLPQALIAAAATLDVDEWRDHGLATLDWLMARQTAPGGHYRPVGSESFGRVYASPRAFDQQPLEAAATVDACIAAFSATGERGWADRVDGVLAWFDGANDLEQALATPLDGGCYDGLTPFGVNLNQGAESILALQMARKAARALPEARKRRDGTDTATAA